MQRILQWIFKRLPRSHPWVIVPLETPLEAWPELRHVAVPIPEREEGKSYYARVREAQFTSSSPWGSLTLEVIESERIALFVLLRGYGTTCPAERALGTGDREELATPYKSILANLRKYFNEDEQGEMPLGLHGWRLFFERRGWDRKPPEWMQLYIEPITAELGRKKQRNASK